jgi:hypothetical protein
MQSDSQGLVRVMGKDVIAEMASTCVLMRTRLISRAITGIYDEKLQPFGIGAAHFALLVVIHQTQPATRAGNWAHSPSGSLDPNATPEGDTL